MDVGWVTEVGSEGAGHSRSPLLPLPAAAGAPLASHAIERGDHEEQEAHADGHSHDGHSSLGGLGGHCGDETEEALSARAPCARARHHRGYSPGPKWNTCRAFPWGLEASQDTPSWLRALVTFRVRELLTQPWPPGAGSAGCGGSESGQGPWDQGLG